MRRGGEAEGRRGGGERAGARESGARGGGKHPRHGRESCRAARRRAESAARHAPPSSSFSFLPPRPAKPPRALPPPNKERPLPGAGGGAPAALADAPTSAAPMGSAEPLEQPAPIAAAVWSSRKWERGGTRRSARDARARVGLLAAAADRALRRAQGAAPGRRAAGRRCVGSESRVRVDRRPATCTCVSASAAARRAPPGVRTRARGVLRAASWRGAAGERSDGAGAQETEESAAQRDAGGGALPAGVVRACRTSSRQ